MSSIKNTLFNAVLGLAIIAVPFKIKAQDLKSVIKLTESEQFENASANFKKLIQATPKNGDLYFYCGENFFKWDKEDSAQVYYQKGTEAEPSNPLNYVGLGKIAFFAEDVQKGQSYFDKANTLLPSKANKQLVMAPEKHQSVLVKMAETYTNAPLKKLDDAKKLLEAAININPKNPDVYVVFGDYYLESNDGSTAIINYKKCQELDPTSSKAKLRIGKLYERARNYPEALKYYKEAVAMDSTFAPAYRELGELFSKAQRYDEAKENYKKFLKLSSDNISARVRYASFLFMTKSYDETINQVYEINKVDTSYVFLNRLIGYSFYEKGQIEKGANEKANYEKGLAAMKKFFAQTKKEKIITSDYGYYGRLLSKNKQDSLAEIQYVKALELDTANVDYISELATVYKKLKRYDKAANCYQKKIDLNKATVSDYLNLGQSYYMMGSDSVAQKAGKSDGFFNIADSIFTYVINTKPDLVQGFIWSARTKASLDPDLETAVAKPAYEALLPKVQKDSVKYTKELVETYLYLASYNLYNKNYPQSRYFYERILAIDPKHEQASNCINNLLKKPENLKALEEGREKKRREKERQKMKQQQGQPK